MQFPSPLLAIALISPAVAGDAKSPVATSPGGWEFSLSAGPSVRNVGQIKINSGYRSGGFLLPSFVGDNSLVTPPVGDPGVYGDRTYDDGYVFRDASTEGVDGSTWYWGYNSASQVQGDELVFHATGFQSIRADATRAPAGGPSTSDSLIGAAPHIQFDARSPHFLGPFRLGFTAAMDFTKVGQSLAFSNFAATQTRDDFRLDYEDRYDLDGVIPPQAPYAGGFDGPGPLIGNLPVIRTVTPVLLGTDTAVVSNQVWSSIDIDALSFTFGPTLGLERGAFDFAVSGGLIVNLYDWSARQSETLSVTSAAGTAGVARWAESSSGAAVRPGLYLQGESGYAFTENFGLGAYLRLDAAPEFRAQAGPTVFKIDPYGLSVGLQFRYQLP